MTGERSLKPFVPLDTQLAPKRLPVDENISVFDKADKIFFALFLFIEDYYGDDKQE